MASCEAEKADIDHECRSIYHICTACCAFLELFVVASLIALLLSIRVDLYIMESSADELDDHDCDAMSIGESNQDLEFECIFCVGNFFIDLSRFHKFGQVENFVNQGWKSFDALSQAQGVVITEDMNVESYTLENAQAFEQEGHVSSTLHVLLKFPKKQRFLVYDAVNWKLFTI